MSFSENIRNVRQKALLNQESFAEELNVSLITVHRWEAGKSLPNLTAMRALKEFCLRQGLAYSALENDWIAERLTESRSKPGKRAGKRADTGETLTKKITVVKETLAKTGERLAGKCDIE